jgi:hypothetical protein
MGGVSLWGFLPWSRREGLDLVPLLEKHALTSSFHAPLFAAVVHNYPAVLELLFEGGLRLTPELASEHLLLHSPRPPPVPASPSSFQKEQRECSDDEVGAANGHEEAEIQADGSSPSPGSASQMDDSQSAGAGVCRSSTPLPSNRSAQDMADEHCSTLKVTSTRQAEGDSPGRTPECKAAEAAAAAAERPAGHGGRAAPSGRVLVREAGPSTESLSLLMCAASVGNLAALRLLLRQGGAVSRTAEMQSLPGFITHGACSEQHMVITVAQA